MTKVSSSNGLEHRPKIGFLEFSNKPWQEKTLKQMGSFFNGLSGKNKNDFNHGDAKYITYRNVFANTFASLDQLEQIEIKPSEKQNKVKYGDVIFTQSSETFEELGLSSVWLHNYQPYLNSFCMGWRPKDLSLHSPIFMGYLLRTENVRKQIIVQGQGISRINLSSSRIENIKLYFPTYNEQIKIANFISLIDQKIQKQQKLIELLKKYKKGLIKHIFTPNTKSKKSSWNSNKLGNLGTFIKAGPLSKSDITEKGNPLILYGELYTTYGDVIHNIVRCTNKNVDNSFYSKKGDVIIPTSGESAEEISTASCVFIDGVILGGDMLIFRSNQIDGRIVSYILNHIVNNKIARIAQGKSIVHIQAKEIENIIIEYPDMDTQNKIAITLDLLDHKINDNETLLFNLINQKKSFLQQLFI